MILPQFWRNILAISRAYSIPYTILAGLAALGSNYLAPSSMTLVLNTLIPLGLAVGLAALNDYIHRHHDLQRNRDYSLRLLLGLGLLGSGLALLCSFYAGSGTLLGIVLCMLCGLAYARFKHHPGLANLLRGFTSVGLVMGLAALNQAAASALTMALGFGILDAAGNIFGDIRDKDKDKRVGVRTLAVIAPQHASWIATGLFVCALVFLGGYTQLVWLFLPLIVWVWYTPSHWQHRAFLVLKYILSIVLALTVSVTPIQTIASCFLSAMVPIAWWVYTYIHG